MLLIVSWEKLISKETEVSYQVVTFNMQIAIIGPIVTYVCNDITSLQDLFFECNPLCSHQMEFNTLLCYDQCHCSVQSAIFSLQTSALKWSNISTCYIGPKGLCYCSTSMRLGNFI